MTIRGFEEHTELTAEMLARLDQFVAEMQRHTHGAPIHGAEMCRLMGWVDSAGRPTDAKNRAMVSYSRAVKAMPIGSEGTGYFWARHAEELNATLEHLRARLNKLRRVVRGVEEAQANLRRDQTQLFDTNKYRERET